jgi:hypothetical protein
MAPTLVATAGSASANSYATQAEGDTYCDTRLNVSAWTGAVSADKDRALISATRELSTFMYKGLSATDTQALVWPRQYAEDPDAAIEGTYFDSDVVPQRIKDATCELALQYLKSGTTDLSALDANQGVIEKTVGPLTTRWAAPYLRAQTLIERFPLVESLIKPLLIVQGHSVPLVRG